MTTATAAFEPARVLYDGDCAFCRKSVALLRRLDWFGKLAYVNVRNEAQLRAIDIATDPDRLLEEMHLIPPDHKKLYHGFGTLQWMAWRLPLLMPIAPLMHLPGVPALGQRLYLWVAKNRFQIIPCHGGVCTLPSRGGHTETS